MAILIIVESPTKAKTISRFLGKNYKVLSSAGHLRDLPKSKIGLDVAHDFAPQYVIAKDKKNLADDLKAAAKKAKTIYLATDEDREGEAIAWHLTQILDLPEKEVERLVFHEITEKAILEAIQHPRHLDLNLVDAQQARRFLDRLVGYELSPLLWKKIAYGLSAGRVQSVALRLIVECEDEIRKFITTPYSTIEGDFTFKNGLIHGKLYQYENKTVEQFTFSDQMATEKIAATLNQDIFTISDKKTKEVKKNPLPPFTTSTLQQEASKKLGFSPKQTMMLAQKLYEGIDLGGGPVGLITYMRTDSLNLSLDFLSAAQSYLKKHFGNEYALTKPRFFKTKSKGAQEAHEAIRPTDVELSPEDVASHLRLLDKKLFTLYRLIYNRALASQMPEARLEQTSLDIAGKKSSTIFRATGSRLLFPGFLKLWQINEDEAEENERRLPEVAINEKAQTQTIKALAHTTEPPARFTEANLIKTLEEYGIGRPSTYAPTLATLLDRKYVTRENKKLTPTDMGEVVTNFLKEHFKDIVDFDFTAKMEEQLDEIAEGKAELLPVLKNFYGPFHKNIETKTKEVNRSDFDQASDELCPKCGSPMIIKIGRFGKFLACSKYPDCKTTKPLAGSEEAAENLGACPDCGGNLVPKRGRFGAFIACSNYPTCKYTQKNEKPTGVHCPKCETGDIVIKKSKRGKIFYACNKYPACDFSLWYKPTGDKCALCQSLLIEKGKHILCSNSECVKSKLDS